MLYYINLNDEINSEAYNLLLSYASIERRKKIDKLKFQKDKTLSLLAFCLLRYSLYVEFGIKHMPEFTYQKEKKPILEKNRDIHFNLTHCDTGVACGVSGMPIGVDIQDITSYDAQIANYFMSSNELLAVENATNKSDVFTLLWALKESYTKYLGTGILCDLKQIDFSKFICLSCDGGEFELYNMNFKIEKRIFGMLASCSHSKIIHVPLTFNELAENLHNMSNKQNII